MEERPDDVLLAAWRDGDAKAGRRLVDRHLTGLARFFANKVTAEHEAKDLVAETFAAFAGALDRYAGRASVRTYLFAIAHNVLREHLRRKRRDADHLAPEVSLCDFGPSPSAMLARDRDERRLLHALRELPLEQQVVLELSFFEDLSRTEIAEVLGVAPGTVASRMRLARERLLARLSALAESQGQVQSTDTDLARWALGLREALTPRS